MRSNTTILLQLEKNFDSKKIEDQVRQHLSKLDLRKMIFETKTKKIVFIEGPPTMNGTPHVGHLRGRVIKDLWYRYMTLRGHKIVFNAGWDTQGLPVELQAEKELGVTGGKNEIIKTIGIEKLVQECKRLVHKYNEKWVQVDNLLGMSFDQKNAYWTYKDNYIEREWQFLKKAHQTGILTEGYRVVAYCPSCQTSLSHAEVNQGYDIVEDPSLYYKVKIDGEDIYFVVWTTMPFTLITDAMIGVNPEENYHHVQVNGQTWIIGQRRLEEFAKEAKISNYKILKTQKGAEFEGKKYIHPLLDKIPKLNQLSKEPNMHRVVAEPFVDANTGSGIVHLSPANGEDDYEIAMKRNVTIFNPIDDEVKFTGDAGSYANLFVRDADRLVMEDLRNAGSLVRIGRIKHKYPLCWRSHHPIIWLARREFFYMLDRLGDMALEAAENVEYFFEQPKNRFLGIIREKHPWCISRERFWGCPLPIWTCSQCGNVERLFSRKEIINAASELPDGPDFELHRPWIDRVIIPCKKCGSPMEREKFVLDTWHNSGSAPYSSLSDQEYKEGIPAPFLTEGIDQTRGWAYTLLIENVILNNKPVSPFRSFLFHGHVLDKNGNKMSKSLGNVMDAEELLVKYPVDLVRFYFIWKSSPIEPINFSTDELTARPYQVLNTLYHIHLYFKQNSEYDKFDTTKTVWWAKEKSLLHEPDIWILSKLQKLKNTVQQNNDICRYHESARALEDFIINSLSQVYIPITKAELWEEDSSKNERRFAIYSVLYEVLKTLDVLIHPLCPYTSEYLYLTTFGTNSILLQTWPATDSSLINDSIEESFDLLQKAVSVSAAARMKAKLKRRWPLNEAIICVNKDQKAKIEKLTSLLSSQLNVEAVKLVQLDEIDGLELVAQMLKLNLPVRPVLDLDRKKIGPKAKQNINLLLKSFCETEPLNIVNKLVSDGNYTFDLVKEKLTLQKDDFVAGFEAKDGYSFAQRYGFLVFISTTRNREMTARGLIKDLARRLQTLRKERGFNPTQILNVASILGLDLESQNMVKERVQELAFLVRVKQIDFEGRCTNYKEDDIDGQKIRIGIQ